jgi:hypothetical protein
MQTPYSTPPTTTGVAKLVQVLPVAQPVFDGGLQMRAQMLLPVFTHE